MGCTNADMNVYAYGYVRLRVHSVRDALCLGSFQLRPVRVHLVHDRDEDPTVCQIGI